MLSRASRGADIAIEDSLSADAIQDHLLELGQRILTPTNRTEDRLREEVNKINVLYLHAKNLTDPNDRSNVFDMAEKTARLMLERSRFGWKSAVLAVALLQFQSLVPRRKFIELIDALVRGTPDEFVPTLKAILDSGIKDGLTREQQPPLAIIMANRTEEATRNYAGMFSTRNDLFLARKLAPTEILQSMNLILRVDPSIGARRCTLVPSTASTSYFQDYFEIAFNNPEILPAAIVILMSKTSELKTKRGTLWVADGTLKETDRGFANFPALRDTIERYYKNSTDERVRRALLHLRLSDPRAVDVEATLQSARRNPNDAALISFLLDQGTDLLPMRW